MVMQSILDVPRLRGRHFVLVACSMGRCGPGKSLYTCSVPISRRLFATTLWGLGYLTCIKPRSLWSRKLFVSKLPSKIVIGLQGSQTPRHEPTPESFVFGPRRSLRLHFPHRLQRPPWAKTSISLHSLTECRPVGPLAPVLSNKARCPPSNTHTGRHHMKENG